MRITGGSLRGRIFNPPGNLPARPTTDFAKAALFNILNNHFDFEEITVLDLFAGTGSIAYEFVSRGAKSVTCVDEDSGCIKFIKKTTEDLKIENISFVRADVFQFIEQEKKQYDIIFADPPFEMETTDSLPDLILEKQLIKPEGFLIIEHQVKRVLNSKAIPFAIRKYGNCAYSMYRQ